MHVLDLKDRVNCDYFKAKFAVCAVLRHRSMETLDHITFSQIEGAVASLIACDDEFYSPSPVRVICSDENNPPEIVAEGSVVVTVVFHYDEYIEGLKKRYSFKKRGEDFHEITEDSGVMEK